MYKLIEKGHYITEDHINNMEFQCLETILDKQVCCQSNDLKLIVNYKLLQQQQPPILQMNILRYITKNKSLHKLGKHPVLKLFLDVKNHQFRLVNWLVFIIVCSTFLIMLPAFLFTEGTTDEEKSSKNFLKFLLQLPYLVVITVLELIRLISWGDIKSKSSWLSIFLIASTICLFVTTMYEKPHRIFIAIVLLLSTFKILALINMLYDSFAVHTMLCLIVARTFLKVFLIHLPILIAFGFSFFIIFADTSKHSESDTTPETSEEHRFNTFQDLHGSVLKTLVMFSGEFDASTMFLLVDWYKAILFLCFLMTQIIIYNLANALAINDVEVSIICI